MTPAHDRQVIQVYATARDDLPLCVLLAGQQCLNSVPAQNTSLGLGLQFEVDARYIG